LSTFTGYSDWEHYAKAIYPEDPEAISSLEKVFEQIANEYRPYIQNQNANNWRDYQQEKRQTIMENLVELAETQ